MALSTDEAEECPHFSVLELFPLIISWEIHERNQTSFWVKKKNKDIVYCMEWEFAYFFLVFLLYFVVFKIEKEKEEEEEEGRKLKSRTAFKKAGVPK